MSASKAELRELMRRQLLEGSVSLCAQGNQSPLTQALRKFFPALSQAFLLYWLPEQAEDIYWVLVSRTEIAKVEVERNPENEEKAASVEIVTVEAYRRRRLSQQVKEKLEVALELMEW